MRICIDVRGNMNNMFFESTSNVLTKVYAGSEKDFLIYLKSVLKNEEKKLVVTANPEILATGKIDNKIHEILTNEDVIITADGIGVVKMANKIGVTIPERITGVKLTELLLELSNQEEYKVALFGGKPEVSLSMRKYCERMYPNAKLVLVEDGYTRPKNEVMQEIIDLQPQVVLVALGVPMQEKLLFDILPYLNKAICVGVGGTFDVLSGHKKRAPLFFQKTGLEWAYRIMSEPQRLKKFLTGTLPLYAQWSFLAKRKIKHS
jgi:N-acetylglucosaminyldiphosphoundecaprenol N-acetyl-beta-D-mannosaminyltransferase